jgi:hypothetical protein
MSEDSKTYTSVVLDEYDLIDPISLKPFDLIENVPTTLPCGHTFGLKTITSSFLTHCPTCKSWISCSTSELKKNIVLTNILERKQKTERKFSKKICPSHPNQEAKYICIDEKVLFCEDCMFEDKHNSHKKEKLEPYLELVHNQVHKLKEVVQKADQDVKSDDKNMLEEISNFCRTLEHNLRAYFAEKNKDFSENISKWEDATNNIIREFENVDNCIEKYGNIGKDIYCMENELIKLTNSHKNERKVVLDQLRESISKIIPNILSKKPETQQSYLKNEKAKSNQPYYYTSFP